MKLSLLFEAHSFFLGGVGGVTKATATGSICQIEICNDFHILVIERKRRMLFLLAWLSVLPQLSLAACRVPTMSSSHICYSIANYTLNAIVSSVSDQDLTVYVETEIVKLTGAPACTTSPCTASELKVRLAHACSVLVNPFVWGDGIRRDRLLNPASTPPFNSCA